MKTIQQTFRLFTASVTMLLRDRLALTGMLAFPLLFVVAMSLFDLRFETMPGVGAEGDYFDFVLPGLLAMGLMNFALVGIAAAVARFREMRILKRITATPLRPSSFIAGQVGAYLVIALAQTLIMLTAGVLLGATVNGSWLYILVLAAMGNLVFLAIGFAVAGRADSVDAATNIAGLLTIPLMFLTGLFFPVEAMPAVMQNAVEWLPMTPLVEGMRKISLEGASLTDLGSQLALLGAWVVVSFLIARASFRFGGRSAITAKATT